MQLVLAARILQDSGRYASFRGTASSTGQTIASKHFRQEHYGSLSWIILEESSVLLQAWYLDHTTHTPSAKIEMSKEFEVG
jgi:hypothetical protein